MADQIYIGDFAKGLTTNPLPFNIDNDAFPTMFNFYTWRRRAKRKRGTVFLGQLQRQIQSVVSPNNWQIGKIGVLDGSGNGSFNLVSTTITNITQATQAVVTLSHSLFNVGETISFSGVGGMTQINGKSGIVIAVDFAGGTITVNIDSSAFTGYTSGGTASLASYYGIVPESINLSDGTNTYTEPATPDGTLVGAPGGTGTINYVTGAITIASGAAGSNLIGKFSYYPGLPVMGLRDFVTSPSTSLYPVLLSFDTTYAYQINDALMNGFYNVSYYRLTDNPVVWSGQDFQQFWTTNYSGALWATNNKPGLHMIDGTYVSGSGTSAVNFTFTLSSVPFSTLVVNDVLWFNEWAAGGVTLNGVTGYVSAIVNAATGEYTVTFASSQTVSSTGKVQLLTNEIPGQDGIRWYDGDPTNKTGLPTTTTVGWANFAPPLTALTVSIDNRNAAKYYLVGALAILPFKDRLLFFSPWIQTSGGAPIQLQDTVLWSWNGTPYYTVDSSGNPYNVPAGQTANVAAYYVDQTGKGGYLPAGIEEPIVTVTFNEDVLLVGFGRKQTRFVYTGNDLYPFLFFVINSELGSSGTFSGITLDRGGVSVGRHGILITTQQSAERLDLPIPDSVFQIQAPNNGVQRINAARDFFKEWVYFAYPVNTSKWKYPTQTFMWNYRDDTWAIFYENFTAHGLYRKSNKYTWKTIPFKTWAQWQETWNSGATSVFFPSVVAGNPQGYVLIKGQGTGESVSGSVTAVASSGSDTQITSTNHCVALGDYLLFTGFLGTTAINNKIGKVITIVDANNFVVDVPFPAGTYLGLGQYTRLSQPLIQTKQFPVYWNEGRQVRLAAQKYLMDKTTAGQVTVNIYLSQDPDDAWNDPGTNPLGPNSSIVYTQLMYTCPESSNIGLTPANTNLQMPTAERQFQIWHRLNTSLIGDTVQIGITLSDAQMRDLSLATAEITLHGMVLVTEKGPHLA